MATETARKATEKSMGLLHETVTQRILASFYEVYAHLGHGFLESVYARALESEMRLNGLRVEREVPIDVHYKSHVVGNYRADQLVNDVIVLEIKATRALVPADYQQLLNCLRGTRLEVGLLLHFGPKPRFKRIVASNDQKLSVAFRSRSVPRPSA